MDLARLEKLLGGLESDRVERKASLSDNEKIAQAVCACEKNLPNHCLPRVIFLGVKDDGAVPGSRSPTNC